MGIKTALGRHLLIRSNKTYVLIDRGEVAYPPVVQWKSTLITRGNISFPPELIVGKFFAHDQEQVTKQG